MAMRNSEVIYGKCNIFGTCTTENYAYKWITKWQKYRFTRPSYLYHGDWNISRNSGGI